MPYAITSAKKMKLVNIDYLPGEEITEVLGLVKGTIVQSKNIGRDFMAGMKTIVGELAYNFSVDTFYKISVALGVTLDMLIQK